jgi:putative CocE/NonD family hydrolase
MATFEPAAAPSEQEGAHARLLPQLNMMLRGLLSSTVGRTLLLLVTALFLTIAAVTYGQVRLNRWYQPFYDAISRRDFSAFLSQLGVFCLIAGGLLILTVIQTWIQETLKVRLREGLVRELLHVWMQPRRALMLAHSGSIGVNPDQRMHEDASRLSELSTDLGSGLLQSSVLLFTFIGVLWVLSRRFVFHFGSQEYPVPGYMVWAAILYALVGSALSYRVGRTLIPRNAERYAREADLRFSLVRVNEHLDGISLAHGETGELRRVELHLNEVLYAMRRIVTGLTNLTWVTSGFGWITIVAPIIVASPLYFDGTLSFGGMMQAAAAFQQAQSSLSWFVNNFRTIADWRAILLRVANFRRALLTADAVGPDESRIDYVEGPAGAIVLEDLQIAAGAERDVLHEPRVEVHAGERLLILAEPGTGKTRLFRALAGLWPWGSGRITRPAGERIVYVPRGTPYLPRGSLREVLAYPSNVDSFEAAGYALSLRRLALDRLVPLLDETHRWDRELSQEEQLRLSFARIVLQRPPWLIVDETLGSLDPETFERVLDIFAGELREVGVIHIGSAAARDRLFTHVVRLERPAGTQPRLRPVVLLLLLGLLAPWHSAPSSAAEPGARPPIPAHLANVPPHPSEVFQFRAPTRLNDASTTMLMRDLALRVLPVYSDPDHLRYLTNLSALQLVAGDYSAAWSTRQDLRARLHGAPSANVPEQSVIYDIYAHTEQLASRRTPFGQAFAQSFNAVVPRLDDLSDYTVTSWFSRSLADFQYALVNTLDQLRGRPAISLNQALQVIWAYLDYQLHLSTGPQADVLISADQQARYVIDDQVVIRTPRGVRLAAVLVVPRAAHAPLPTLLEFTIYPYPDNDAMESAAHGYVGMVAYSRGKLIARGPVWPYEHDGEDARAVISWITHQSWSDGRVGMYGSEYSAFTAWAAAKRPPPALRAIAVASAIAPGIDAPDPGNVFLSSAYRWSRYVTGTPLLNDEADQDEAHWLWVNRTWYTEGLPYAQLPRVDGVPSPAFSRWLTHPSYDRYWQAMIPFRTEFAQVRIPVLALTGYFDLNEPGSLYYFRQHLHYDARADHTLVIGPYDDSVAIGLPDPQLQGYALDSAARVDWHALRYQWFDSVFKGGARPAALRGRIEYELMGANRWQQADSLEDMTGSRWRLFLDPAASTLRVGDANSGALHLLRANAGRARDFVAQSVDFRDRSDAAWIAPTALASAVLPTHYSLLYASAPLARAVALAGVLSGELDFTVNKRDFDFTLALYERTPTGTYLKLFDPPEEFRASYVADPSHRRLLHPGRRERLILQGQHLMGAELPAGARLVLALSIVKRPDQEINYGTAGEVADETIADARVPLRIRWYASSHIDLPLQAQTPAMAAPATRPVAAPTATARRNRKP